MIADGGAIVLPNLACEGYEFKGWREGSTTGEFYEPNATYIVDESVTLYADWTKKSTSGVSIWVKIGLCALVVAVCVIAPYAALAISSCFLMTSSSVLVSIGATMAVHGVSIVGAVGSMGGNIISYIAYEL